MTLGPVFTIRDKTCKEQTQAIGKLGFLDQGVSNDFIFSICCFIRSLVRFFS
jgi:hypothetical protein